MNLKYFVATFILITTQNIYAVEIGAAMEQALASENFATIRNLIETGKESVNNTSKGWPLVNQVIYQYAYAPSYKKKNIQEILIYLLNKKAPINDVVSNSNYGSFGETPLHIAVRHNLPEIVKILLDYGASTPIKNSQGNTPLHIAVEENLPDIVEILLNHGADASIKDENYMTPFAIASQNNNQQIMHILRQSGKGSGFAKVPDDVHKRHIRM